jgi:hypothetical protein
MHASGCKTKRDYIAWQMLCHCHSLCKPDEWKSMNVHMLLEIARIAQELGIPDNVDCAPETEALWRTGAMNLFHAELAALRKRTK